MNKILQVTMLKQVMRRWKTVSILKHRSSSSSLSLLSSSATPPSGFLAVYVGHERARFLIPARFLNLPIFVALLQQAEEEFGFNFTGGIALPCEVEFFKQILVVLCKDEKKYGRLEVNEFLKIVSEMGFDSSSCKECYFHDHGFIPTMQKAIA